jgi:hypothetical protein
MKLQRQIFYYLPHEDFEKLKLLSKKLRLSYSALTRSIIVREIEKEITK